MNETSHSGLNKATKLLIDLGFLSEMTRSRFQPMEKYEVYVTSSFNG